MTFLVHKGDGIKGEKVSYQCRNPHTKGVTSRRTSGTSRDNSQRGSLEGTVTCVIEREFRSLRNKSIKSS